SAGLMKNINERRTLIGYHNAWTENCKANHLVSIGYFMDKLCSLAGICAKLVDFLIYKFMCL
ncbi:uncharacterized protein NESG_02475, partial [Nematocida ausubeli]